MVTQKDTYVHLETMETTVNKGKELDEARNARMESVSERKGYWAIAGSGILHHTITNERLVRRGYYDISEAYKPLHSI